MSATKREQTSDLKDHELWWMFSDAVGLFHLGRRYSSMLLLLCAVDALAKRSKPTIEKVGDRFRELLKEKLPKYTRVDNFNIHVPQHGDYMRLEAILYKYLRNPMVHEGAHLDVEDSSGFAVCIDWSHRAPSVRVDQVERAVVLGGEWIVDVLGGVVTETIGEQVVAAAGGQP